MQEFVNILDENILKDNIKFASLFVLNYECLRDYLVSQMRDFFSDEFKEIDGQWQTVESQKYKDEIKRLNSNKNKLYAAIAWFKELEAIDQNDITLLHKVRKRRNSIVHEYAEELMKGFSGEDLALFASMVNLYRKIDRWWINEIEIPISGQYQSDEYDHNGVQGGQAIILSTINDIALGKAGAYKELLQMLHEKTR